jgi:septal ring factor EnvC (AmiA/AmiB activator)
MGWHHAIYTQLARKLQAESLKKTMSIRMLAKELYRLEQEVESLEKRLEKASPEERNGAENQLMRLRAERDRLRSILAAKKEPPPYRHRNEGHSSLNPQ